MRWFLEVSRTLRQAAETLGVFVFGAALVWIAISSSVWVGQRVGVAVGTLAFATWLAGWWCTNRRLKMNEIRHSQPDAATADERLHVRK